MTNDVDNSPLLHTLTQDLEALNELLRGELAAVATYEQCIEALDDEVIATALQDLLSSHMQRRDQLVNRLRLMGDEPDHSPGLWGAFAQLVEGGAALLGDKIALEALESGELHGLRLYHDTEVVHVETRQFIDTHLLPEQERTRAALGKIVRAIA